MDDLDLGVIGLFAPKFYKRIMEQRRREEKDRFRQLKKSKKPEAWDDLCTKFQKEMWLDARSWKPVQLFDVKPLRGKPGKRVRDIDKGECVAYSPSRRFVYVNHVLPKSTPLRVYCDRQRGVVYFSDDIVSPNLSEIVPGEALPQVWMSMTPMEFLSQRPAVRLATGKVVIGGLGLGWLLDQVCRKKTVTEVLLVEREKELLDWLAPRILERYPAVAAKTSFMCEDVYAYMEMRARPGDGVRYLLDIWDKFNTYDHRFWEWKKKLGRCLWGWGMFDD